MKLTARSCLVALVPVFFLLACPDAKPPPPVAVPPTTPVAQPPTPEEAPPPAESPPPPRPTLTLNEPAAVDGGTLPEEAMPGWNKVEVGDYVVYDVETSRDQTVDVFRIGGGTRTPPVSARVKLTAMVVDKSGVVVDVRYVPNGTNTTAPRWLESGLSFKVAVGGARPRLPAVGSEAGLMSLPPKTPFKSVEHAGKTYKCRFHRAESATPEGTPSRRCVGSPDRALILGGGTVYAQGVKGGDGNPMTAVLVEAGKTALDGKPGYEAFQDATLVTRQTSPAGERLSFLKVGAAGGLVKTDETAHMRAATGQAAALTYDGANWLKPEVKTVNQEVIEWVAARFTDDGLFNMLPENGNPGAAVVYGPTRIDTTTVGVEVPAMGEQPARTFRWLVPTRPTAIKTAPVWIRFGSVELTVHEGERSWKRRVVTFQK